MKFSTCRTIFGTFAISLASWAGTASAAPQILGLVATAEPTKLICENGVCQAEFSAICLQKHRVAPREGSLYHQAAATKLQLSVTQADGTEITVPVGSRASITSGREFTSVVIAIPEVLVQSMGGQSAAISVPPLASLVPVAEVGDTNPLGAAEIEQFTGPLRASAEQYIQNDPDLPAARFLNRVLNSFEKGDAPYMANAQTLWDRGMKNSRVELPEAAKQHAAGILHECTSDTPNRSVWGTHGCVALRHDAMMMKTTRDVWNGLGAGG